MAVDLMYKHQQKAYELMKEELKKSKKAAYEFPTGCGKTFPGLKYIEDNQNKTVLIIVPSTHIRDQWKKNIEKYVENGSEMLKNRNIAIVTYQKVALLSKKVKNLKTDVIIIDEVHRMGAEKWEPSIDALMERQPDSEIIAMTATPKRTDRRNMLEEKFGNNIVYEMSLTEALSGEKEGEIILKSPRYIRVLSTLKPQIKQYKEKILEIEDAEKKQELLKKYERLETIISREPDVQDIMLIGMQKKNGKYIVFCKDREDIMEKMEQAQEIFGKVNSKIAIHYLLSKNGKGDTFGKTLAENKNTLENFENLETSDELQLLFCVDKLNEGVHVEGIDGEVLFDLTKSPVLYKQRIGRVTTQEKETVIIDAVNNWLAQINTYREIHKAIKKGEAIKGETEVDYSLLELTPEETELLEILREIGENLKTNDNQTYEEIIKWLDTHDRKMPKSVIAKNGRVLKANEMSIEERKEIRLYNRWRFSKEKEILEEYIGKSLEEVPEEYREKIKVLRSYGIGVERKKVFYERLIEWLETHEGRMPRSIIVKNSKILKVDEMSDEERYGVNLYARWLRSNEKNILEKYRGKTLEEVPGKHREKIRVLRTYEIGQREKTIYEEIIEWLETHEGKMPRGIIIKNGRTLKVPEQTSEEKQEQRLYERWIRCKEKIYWSKI